MKPCASYEQKLSDYLDWQLTLEEQAELREHLARCPACRAALRDLESLRAQLAAIPTADPPPELLEGVLRGIHGAAGAAAASGGQAPGKNTGRSGRVIPWRYFGAAAAALAVAVGLWAFLGRGTGAPPASLDNPSFAPTPASAPTAPEAYGYSRYGALKLDPSAPPDTPDPALLLLSPEEDTPVQPSSTDAADQAESYAGFQLQGSKASSYEAPVGQVSSSQPPADPDRAADPLPAPEPESEAAGTNSVFDVARYDVLTLSTPDLLLSMLPVNGASPSADLSGGLSPAPSEPETTPVPSAPLPTPTADGAAPTPTEDVPLTPVPTADSAPLDQDQALEQLYGALFAPLYPDAQPAFLGEGAGYILTPWLPLDETQPQGLRYSLRLRYSNLSASGRYYVFFLYQEYDVTPNADATCTGPIQFAAYPLFPAQDQPLLEPVDPSLYPTEADYTAAREAFWATVNG